MRKPVLIFAAFLFILSSLNAQDEVLMTIGNTKVTKAEFERIYNKNNSSVVYENKSPQEYLDLFINFKLKVIEAEALGYDTMKTFIKELAGYRDQLAKPYLQDKELIQQMLEEAYMRTTTEVNASHISIKLAEGAIPADTLIAYNKLLSIRDRILAGESFEDLALASSEDPSAKSNKGNLGWFSAFRMVFPFEDIAYKTPVGQISMPVRTRYGYHIVRTNGFRPAKGEVLLAHIMVQIKKNDSADMAAAKNKISGCYEQLKNGGNFADIAKTSSEDQASARYGGKLRWIRSGELPENLEEKVFVLTDSGQYTEPLLSDYGFHIFQILGKRPIKSFNEMKSELEDKLTQDRQKNTDLLFVEKLKKAYGFTEYPDNLKALIEAADSSLYEKKWEPALATGLVDPIFTIGKRDYSQHDLVNYMNEEKRYLKKVSLESIIRNKYTEFAKAMVLEYEKDGLEQQHPEFRYLMEEYHDGILLFNITDDKVWSKAVKDTAGLLKYYAKNKKQYLWSTRADVSIYTTKDSSLTGKIITMAPERFIQKWSAKEMNAKVCGQDSIQCIEVEDHKYERGTDKIVDAMVWGKGTVQVINENGKAKIVVINDILKPQQKKLAESRGLVTADYQNQLEKIWIKQLRKKYPVIVYDKVLATIK